MYTLNVYYLFLVNVQSWFEHRWRERENNHSAREREYTLLIALSTWLLNRDEHSWNISNIFPLHMDLSQWEIIYRINIETISIWRFRQRIDYRWINISRYKLNFFERKIIDFLINYNQYFIAIDNVINRHVINCLYFFLWIWLVWFKKSNLNLYRQIIEFSFNSLYWNLFYFF